MPRRGQAEIKPPGAGCRWLSLPATMCRMLPNLRHAALLLGVSSISCGDSPDLATLPPSPPGFAYAYAAPSCAPWDGPAVSLVLRSDPLAGSDSLIEQGDRPQLRISIYPREAGGLARRTYRWPRQPEEAAASRCESGQCDPVSAGWVTIRTIAPDSQLTGELELRFEGGGTARGGFRAAWRSRRYFCG